MPLRYVVVSYLNLVIVLLSYFFDELAHSSKALRPIIYAFFIFLLMMWPLFTIYFLFKNQTKLIEKSMKHKYHSLYEGLDT